MSQNSGIPPWHLWGNSQTLASTSLGGAAAVQPTPGQMVKASYKRPETWHWVFGVELLSGPTFGVGGNGSLRVDFDVILGVGRSQFTIRSFETFIILWNATPAPVGRQKWSTEAIGPERNEALPAPPILNTIQQLVAQDIQVVANVRHTSTAPGTIATCMVHALFAPKVHIRPSWWKRIFNGGED